MKKSGEKRREKKLYENRTGKHIKKHCTTKTTFTMGKEDFLDRMKKKHTHRARMVFFSLWKRKGTLKTCIALQILPQKLSHKSNVTNNIITMK